MPVLRAAAALLALAATAAAGVVIRVPQDFGTIQQAADTATPGDTVLVSAGTYAGVTLSAVTGITVRGKGAVVIDAQGGATPIKILNGTDIAVIGLRVTNSSSNGLEIADSSQVLVSKCKFDGIAGNGVNVTGSDGVSCIACQTQDVPGVAFAYAPELADTVCNDALVQKCKIVNSPIGIHVRGDAPRVEKNAIAHASTAAIDLQDVTAGVITKNKITDEFGGEAIRVKDTSATTEITSNSISGTGAGIDVEDSQQTNLRKNKIVIEPFGCVFSSCSECLGEKNTILCSDAWVVQICDHITLSKNKLRGDDGGPGLSFTFSDACTADGDRLSHFAGAFNITGDDDAVTGCSVNHVSIGLAMDAGNSNTQVTGLRAKLCGDTGLLVDGTGAIVTGCKITRSLGDGLRVFGTGATLTANVVSKAGSSGVHLEAGSSGNTLSANRAKGSHDFDLLDESGGANTVNEDNIFKTQSP
jgi:parallel beta-helix repeat protein